MAVAAVAAMLAVAAAVVVADAVAAGAAGGEVVVVVAAVAISGGRWRCSVTATATCSGFMPFHGGLPVSISHIMMPSEIGRAHV